MIIAAWGWGGEWMSEAVFNSQAEILPSAYDVGE